MGRLKTSVEYNQELFDKELDFLPLEDYKGANTKILHECVKEHKWLVEPNSILRGIGCPSCAVNRRLTTEEYIEKLELKHIKYRPIEPYITSLKEINHICEAGHIWKVKPCHVLNYSGCNKCTYSTFDPNSPAMLYYIKIGDYYKIGITKRSIKARFSKDSDKSIIILKISWFAKGSDARYLEQLILKYNSHRLHVKNYLRSGGNTELFSLPINWPE